MLGVIILLGLLVLLFVGVFYLGTTQKPSSHRAPLPGEDWYRSRGMGNVIDARQQINDVLAVRPHRSASRLRRAKNR